MKLVFYSIFFNHHQAWVADELYNLLGDGYRFVELSRPTDLKGATSDLSKRPYIIKAWETPDEYALAEKLATTSDVCVFSGYESITLMKKRLAKGLFSFDMGERLLKRGWVNLLSPRILKMVSAYHLNRWNRKPLYKLCCSAYTCLDAYKLRSYIDKCYKWGYFTNVDMNYSLKSTVEAKSVNGIVKIMWCARFLTLKHPELPILLAKNLREKGFNFQINIYGGEFAASKFEKYYPEKKLRELIETNDLSESVIIRGAMPNDKIIEAMRNHEIFLFTSDRLEGWGAVANESLSNGCVLVASDAIGSSPYLIKEGYNGFTFKNCNVDSLTEKVEWLLRNPDKMEQIRINAINTMKDVWSPRQAANNLLRLIASLQNGEETPIINGPCSKA